MSASEWRSISRPVAAYGSSGEQIARAALLQIMQNLDEQCALVENLWDSRDQDWAAAMDIPYKQTIIARPQKDSFYLGAQPSLVAGQNARFDKWPAITVRCGTRTPSSSQIDQADQWDRELIIEVLATAGPFARDPLDDRSTSDQVDRQYQRLSDAVVACIDQDRTLGGNTPPIQNPPEMTPSLPYIIRTKQGAGQYMVNQAMEIRYPSLTGFSLVPGL